MMKRMSMGSSKEENYEHVLMCLICRSLFDDNDHQPKFLPCHHTFCKDCLREYVRQVGEEIECPSCRKIATVPTAGVTALQTNFYVKYIHNLVQGVFIGDGSTLECGQHPGQKLKYFCKECIKSICEKCCEPTDKGCCAAHKKVTLTAGTEEYHQKLDTGFAKSHAMIEHKKVELEAILKALSHEKDQALLKIDSTYEQHAHTLNRRTTLLKNKVIAIYNEHVEKLEADLEEVSTAMTCIVSLKEFHEIFLSKGDFHEIDRGISEMEEVQENIREKIQPRENHIIFEDKHGVDKFKACVKDLGRVRCSRPTIPRSEPEGNDATGAHISPSTPGPSDSDSGISPLAYGDTSTGLQASGVGASGGGLSTGPQPPQTAGADEPKPTPMRNDQMSSSFHAQMGSLGGDALLLKSSGESALDKRVGSGCHVVPNQAISSSCDAAMNCPGASAGQTPPVVPAPTSAGSDKPVMVVRPKTLKTSNILTKKPDKPAPSKSAKVKPMAMVSQLISQSKQGAAVRSTAPPINGDDVFHESDDALQSAECQLTDMEDKNANKLPAVNDGPNKPQVPIRGKAGLVNPKEEILKQTDKMYHHLVYTSYDEEELLRELQAGKVQVDPPPAAPVTSRRNMEDSDSWMTVSSDGDSTISGNSDDLSTRDMSQL